MPSTVPTRDEPESNASCEATEIERRGIVEQILVRHWLGRFLLADGKIAIGLEIAAVLLGAELDALDDTLGVIKRDEHQSLPEIAVVDQCWALRPILTAPWRPNRSRAGIVSGTDQIPWIGTLATRSTGSSSTQRRVARPPNFLPPQMWVP